jgi:diamine N-acetyltransferase
MGVRHNFKLRLEGEFIYLAEVRTKDAELIYKLRTSESAKLLNKPEGYDVEMQRDWILSRNSDEKNYIIYNKVNSIPVGMIGIYDCDFHSGVSNCGRLLLFPWLIAQGSPFGLEALKICYSYIFNEMGFRKISGTIAGSNIKVISLQKYLGMTQEGILKGHALINGEYEDLYVYSLFKDDYSIYAWNIDKLLNKYR